MLTAKRIQSACNLSKVAILFIIFLLGRPVFAQTVGTLLGTVKDSSGAVVPGANVTARETETGASRSLPTGSDGSFRFPALPVGHYELKAEHAGFKSAAQTGIILDVAQEVVINFALQVGAVTSEITVNATPPVVDTTSSALGGLVSERSIAELPLNGRNYLDLSLLQPGVSQDTVIQNAGGGSAGTIYSSNGAPVTSNAFLLDGTPTQTLLGFNGSSATGNSLGVDGILEYKVVTNSFSAEYGMNMGSQMAIITKGGSNEIHGDVFEYIRNRVFDARNFFDDSQANCLAGGGKNCPRSPQYQRNNFGGAFGGPIKKDKTFYWAVFEGLRQVKGNAIVAKGIPAACVAAGTTAPYTVTGAECGFSNPYYTMTVNSAILPVLAMFAPKYADYTQISHESVDHGQIRVDQSFSGKDTLFGRYTIDDASEVTPGPGNGATPYGYGEFQDTITSRSQFATLSETHVFTPLFLNTARLSFSRTNLYTASAQTTNASAANVSNFAGGNTPMGMFVIGSTGMTSSYYTVMGADQGSPNRHLQNYWSVGDDLFYTRGKHSLKFGFLGNRIQYVANDVWDPYGSTSFSNYCTANINANYMDATGLLCFLANQPFLELALLPGSQGHRTFNYYTYGFYGQDDWRMSSRLTLNLGLRYEFNTTLNEAHGLQNSFLNPAANVSVVGGSSWTNPLTAGAPVSNPSLKNFSPRLGFALDPTGRGTTSIHGAAGVYYDVGMPALSVFSYSTGDAPYAGFQTNITSLISGGYLANCATSSNANGCGWEPGFMSVPASAYGQFQPPFLWPGSTNTFAGFFPEDDYNSNQYRIKQSYLMQWNFSVDQQLPGAIGLTAAYVGTRGIHLWGNADGNPCIPTGYTNGLPNWANSLGTGGAPIECPFVNSLYSSSTGYAPGPSNYFQGGHGCTVNSVNPYVGTVYVTTGRANCNIGEDDEVTTNAESWYNSLQVTLQKRISHGLEFQSAYTWSKSFDTTQGSEPIYSEVRTPYAPTKYDRGLNAYNALQNWRFNALYHFPTMSSKGFLPTLVNGWWTGNIIAVQSGYPFTPVAPGDVSLNEVTSVPAGYERPDIVTSANIGDVKTCVMSFGFCTGSTPQGRVYNPNAVIYNRGSVITQKPGEWFNTNMFTEPLPGYLGNVSRGFLNGPMLANWDFSLVKDTKIESLGGAGNLQFRAEFFNVLNHTNFLSNPVGGNAISGPAAGALSSASDGRDIQFALKLNF